MWSEYITCVNCDLPVVCQDKTQSRGDRSLWSHLMMIDDKYTAV